MHIIDTTQTYMRLSAVTNYVAVKPDLRLPTKISGTSTYGDASYDVAFEASWTAGKYEIDSLKVIRKPNSPPVDGGVLRGVRVAQAFEGMMHNAEGILLADGKPYKFPYEFELSYDGDRSELIITPTLTVSGRKDEGEREKMLQAARIHAIASAYGVRALRLVMEVLGLQQRSASRLIEKAREQGLLDEKAPGDE